MRLDAVVNQMLRDRPAWQDFAACHDIPTVLFFPTNPRDSKTNLAIITPICESCPVYSNCFAYAMSFGEKQLTGIWAGTTERRRQELKRSWLCAVPA